MKKKPWWKGRIQGDIKKLQGKISVLQRKERGDLFPNCKFEKLEKKYARKKVLE